MNHDRFDLFFPKKRAQCPVDCGCASWCERTPAVAWATPEPLETFSDRVGCGMDCGCGRGCACSLVREQGE